MPWGKPSLTAFSKQLILRVRADGFIVLPNSKQSENANNEILK